MAWQPTQQRTHRQQPGVGSVVGLASLHVHWTALVFTSVHERYSHRQGRRCRRAPRGCLAGTCKEWKRQHRCPAGAASWSPWNTAARHATNRYVQLLHVVTTTCPTPCRYKCSQTLAPGLRAPVRLVRLPLRDARERILRLRQGARVAATGGVVVRVRQVCMARRGIVGKE